MNGLVFTERYLLSEYGYFFVSDIVILCNFSYSCCEINRGNSTVKAKNKKIKGLYRHDNPFQRLFI